MKISEFEPGARLRVTGFAVGDSGYRSKLLSLGIRKGAEFDLVRVAPLGDPLEIKLGVGGNVSLRRSESEVIDVEKVYG
ncbi:MAG: ferrous iron transport protein A [Victivallales bacterium]|nr:ferrous iron transport protein A [Victivallales bacterium]